MKNKLIFIAFYIITAILFIVGPYSIFKICEVGDSPMTCHWSALAQKGIAIILIGTAVIYAVTKSLREKILISGIAVIESIVALLIPSVFIGGCSMKTMPCQTTTFPAFYVITIVLIIVSVTNIIYLSKKYKGKSQ